MFTPLRKRNHKEKKLKAAKKALHGETLRNTPRGNLELQRSIILENMKVCPVTTHRKVFIVLFFQL